MISDTWQSIRERIPFQSSLIIGFGLMAGAFVVFWSLAEEILEGESHAFDEMILLALRAPGDASDPIGPDWIQYAVGDVTALGGYTVLTMLIIASATYLFAFGRWRHALIVIGATVSGALLMHFLKLGFARPRPDMVDHLTHAMNFSFPSGHATVSAVVYLTLGLLMAEAHKQKRMRILIMTGAVITTMLIGMSRIYLGVHYPSDVFAGWALGTGWAMLWWLILRWMMHHKTADPEEDPI